MNDIGTTMARQGQRLCNRQSMHDGYNQILQCLLHCLLLIDVDVKDRD